MEKAKITSHLDIRDVYSNKNGGSVIIDRCGNIFTTHYTVQDMKSFGLDKLSTPKDFFKSMIKMEEEKTTTANDLDLEPKHFELYLQELCRALKNLGIRNVKFDNNQKFRMQLELYLSKNFGKVPSFVEPTPETPVGAMHDLHVTVFGTRFTFYAKGE